MLRYLILMLFSVNVFAHGSIHPKWKYYIDDLGRPYFKCDHTTYSEYSTLFESYKTDKGEYQMSFYPRVIIDHETYMRLANKVDRECPQVIEVIE